MRPSLPVIIYCDNSGAIFLINNHETRMSKHLDIKVHIVRSYVEKGIVKIVFIRMDGNLDDSFTKNSGIDSYERNYCYMDSLCSDV